MPLFLVLALLASICRAEAQTTETGGTTPPRRWDASAGVGVRFFDGLALGGAYSDWNAAWQPRVQLGRYVTPHLKLEVTATSPVAHTFYAEETEALTGAAGAVLGFAEHRTLVFSISPLVTYQFLENAFVHPFVSAGVQMGVLDETISRPQQPRRVNGLTITIPAASRSRDAVLLHPVLAAGFKSYFNERVFVRSEWNLAFRRQGAAHVGLRLDVGIDF